jgi:hypothetical protein
MRTDNEILPVAGSLPTGTPNYKYENAIGIVYAGTENPSYSR